MIVSSNTHVHSMAKVMFELIHNICAAPLYVEKSI